MLWFPINRQDKKNVTQQVYEQIRRSILSKELKEKQRLPSTRELAANIGVSRNTVIEAYDQLLFEGYLIVKPRSGTYVAEGAALKVTEETGNTETLFHEPSAEKPSAANVIDFRAGNPAMDHFPRKKWGKIASDICKDATDEVFGYSNPFGEEALRKVLASYLSRTRGVRCHPKQIVITSGATQGLFLLTMLLAKDGNYVAVEDPVTDEMRTIFSYAGAEVRPIKTDSWGIVPEKLPQKEKPGFVFVIPSHQFPLGITLPIQRRIKLVEYARHMNCYLIEDDYDSEFTYEGTPVFSIQGLEQERVIYVGTFSKILSPALRVGYVILPYPLLEKFQQLKWFSDRHTSSLEQLTMARFIEEGFLDQHVRRMKKIYQKRRKTLVKALQKAFSAINILGQAAGMHLVVEFPGIEFTEEVIAAVKRHYVTVYPVEQYAMQKGFHTRQIVMGYGSLPEEKIIEGVHRLKKAITPFAKMN
ncbi:PLP-dependent aminotransferase family protein [Bacillaceae bacterium Marseille-Q3522]|nr:PLP-dependent aminotransferase family protein [Bacillaceae bacterium Marseille-Q3522]